MPEISIIIPCYNEQDRLPSEAILGFFQSHPAYHLLLVNDGSTDRTQALLDSLAAALPDRIHCLELPCNQGKAEAVRQGCLFMYRNYSSEWYGYWDADLAPPLEEVFHFLEHAGPDTRLILGSRVKRMGAIIQRKVWRHIVGRIMATLISWTLRQPIYDTQCGAKLIRHSEIETVFSGPFLSRWLFDVEIMARHLVSHPGVSPQQSIIEVPLLRWIDRGDSRLKLPQMVRSVLDLARIHWWFSRQHRKADDVG